MTTAASDAYRVALAGLLRCSEPPIPARLAAFIAVRGPVDAWAAIRNRVAPPEVLDAVAARVGSRSAAELQALAKTDLARAAVVGADLIGPDDSDWPVDSFTALEWIRPFDKCRTAAAPIALYRRGGTWPVDQRGAVAIVGSRAATPYGVHIATELAADAVTAGRLVVSGAAFGIDAAAHRGAMHAGRTLGQAAAATMAILPSGIDRPYPAAHRDLIDGIALAGSVVTEYPPGTAPARHRFLVRNRLIAAFAEGTIVVEAGRRSGSLNTASTAGDLGREVLAVPGPVTSAMSVGCHDAISHHRAALITRWSDAAALLGPLVPAASPHRPGDRQLDGLDLVSCRVYDALPAEGALSVDQVSIDAAIPVPDVIGALSVLETGGLVRRDSGLWRRSADSVATR